MEKKRSIKTRLLAAGLALLLLGLGIPMAFAEGEEQIASIEAGAGDLLDFFKSTAEDFSNPEYVGQGVYEHEYVNEAGESRYYLSYLTEIDGFKRTETSKKFEGALWATEEDEYSFEGDYNYLYYNGVDNLLRPTHSKELTMYANDREYRRTKFITSIDDDVLVVLEELNAYRVTDNIFLLGNTVIGMQNKGGIGLGVLLPKELTPDSLVAEYFAITDDENPYNETLNGYLIHNDRLRVGYAYLNATEEEKIFIFERKK